MAKNNDTSAYSDRGTAGTPEELDAYGAWIKSEPQDLSLIDLEDLNRLRESDLDIDMPDFGNFSDGEDLPAEERLGDFDSGLDLDSLPDLEPETMDAGGDFDFQLPEDPFSLPAFVPDLEDLPDFGSPEESAEAADGFSLEAELPGAPEDFDGIGAPGDDISISFGADDISYDALEQDERFPPPFEDLRLDDLSTEDFNDVPSIPQEAEDALVDVSMEDFLDRTPGGAPPLDDPAAEQGVPQKEPELSTRLLMRIADELSSIRGEISALKEELLELRHLELAKAAREGEPGPGRFDDSAADDGTLTLTEEELDAILNPPDGAGEEIAEAAPQDRFLEEAPSAQGELPEEGAFPTFSFEDGMEPVDLSVEEPMDLSVEELADLSVEEPVDLSVEELADLSVEEPAALSVEEPAALPVEEPAWLDGFSGLSPEAPADELLSPPVGEEELSLFWEDDGAAPPAESAATPAADPPIEAPEDTRYLEEESLMGALDLSDQELSPDTIILGLDMKKPLDPAAEEGEDFFTEDEEAVAAGYEDSAPRDSAAGPAALAPEPPAEDAPEPLPGHGAAALPDNLKQELKVVLSYMDQLLESLPDEKIEEFARSEHFGTYKKLFEELGLV